jgi:hypothetical protein
MDTTERIALLEQMVAHARHVQAQTEQQLQALVAQAQQAQQAQAQPLALKPRAPDTFSGEGNTRFRVHDFTQTCTTFFMAATVTDDAQRVRYASTLLRGAAQRWLTELQRTGTVPTTWAAFTAALERHFLPGGTAVAVRSQLDRTRQKTSVGDYADRLNGLFTQAPQMSEDERMAWFLRGLKPHTRIQTEFTRPVTLVDAIEQATRIDDILYSHSSRTSHNQRPTNRSAPEPMQLGAVGRADTRATPSHNINGTQPRLAKLTGEDREHLRSIGACFRCRKTGHVSANCPLRLGNASRQ